MLEHGNGPTGVTQVRGEENILNQEFSSPIPIFEYCGKFHIGSNYIPQQLTCRIAFPCTSCTIKVNWFSDIVLQILSQSRPTQITTPPISSHSNSNNSKGPDSRAPLHCPLVLLRQVHLGPQSLLSCDPMADRTPQPLPDADLLPSSRSVWMNPITLLQVQDPRSSAPSIYPLHYDPMAHQKPATPQHAAEICKIPVGWENAGLHSLLSTIMSHISSSLLENLSGVVQEDRSLPGDGIEVFKMKAQRFDSRLWEWLSN